MIKTYLYFNQISSTSDYLKENYQSLPSLTFIQTGYQTGGRGQFDRVWESTEKENVLFSFLLKDILVDRLDLIKKYVLGSILDTLKQYHISGSFKAPNDIYVNGKKICGILIENLTELENCLYVVVGIGLNVNQEQFTGFSATSLKLETGRLFDVGEVYTTLSNRLYDWMVRVNGTKGIY